MILSEDYLKVIEILYGSEPESIETKFEVNRKAKTHKGKVFITINNKEIESKQFDLPYEEETIKEKTRQEEKAESERTYSNLLKRFTIDFLENQKD